VWTDPRLGAIPAPSERRLAVRITPDALRHVRAGHPWIYDESVTSVSHDGAHGDLAVVFDRDRRFAAIGLYDPDSPIRVRVLHAGAPVPIDTVWWSTLVDAALARRSTFSTDPLADRLGYRLINGENDGCSGMVVDRYAGVLVVKLYSAVWFPRLAELGALLAERTGAAGVVLRLARSLQHNGPTFGLADGDVILGLVPDGPVRFVEHGAGGPLEFDADVRRGQKTGHFLDQRHNRRRLGELTDGADVLDVFASTGGFSVHAAAGGATSVDAVDLSAPTLAAAEHNMQLNAHLAPVAACRFTTRIGDAFAVLAELAAAARRFDVVVVDPPSFAQRNADVAAAVRAYERLTVAAVAVTEPGGLLLQASCSSRVDTDAFHAAVRAGGRRSGRELTEVERSSHDVDHPVTFAEGAYLKAGVWRVS